MGWWRAQVAWRVPAYGGRGCRLEVSPLFLTQQPLTPLPNPARCVSKWLLPALNLNKRWIVLAPRKGRHSSRHPFWVCVFSKLLLDVAAAAADVVVVIRGHLTAVHLLLFWALSNALLMHYALFYFRTRVTRRGIAGRVRLRRVGCCTVHKFYCPESTTIQWIN